MSQFRRYGSRTAAALGVVALMSLPASLAAESPKEVAKQILNEETAPPDREALIAQHKDQSAALIVAMAEGLSGSPLATLPASPDSAEEYRRIPWIWRVAVAAGKRNQADELRRILEVSLPEQGQPLTDWQAVVVGGGVINGLTIAGVWPDERVKEILKGHADLEARWKTSLEQAVAMTDREETPTGTRYDALRMIAMSGWKARGEQLTRYLKKGTHAELQMGAVSGTADVNDPAATKALLSHLNELEPENREIALDGLLRTDDRKLALLEAVRQKKVDAETLGDARRKQLLESDAAAVREAAARALK